MLERRRASIANVALTFGPKAASAMALVQSRGGEEVTEPKFVALMNLSSSSPIETLGKTVKSVEGQEKASEHLQRPRSRRRSRPSDQTQGAPHP